MVRAKMLLHVVLKMFVHWKIFLARKIKEEFIVAVTF